MIVRRHGVASGEGDLRRGAEAKLCGDDHLRGYKAVAARGRMMVLGQFIAMKPIPFAASRSMFGVWHILFLW
jgi:hypothetical protein